MNEETGCARFIWEMTVKMECVYLNLMMVIMMNMMMMMMMMMMILVVIVCQGAVRPCKGKDVMISGLAASVRRSSGPAVSSSSSRSIAIPSVNRQRPIVPCHGSVEGFNQVSQPL